MLLHRKFCHPAFRKCRATACQRTEQTIRRLRSALNRPEIHYSLIINSRMLLIQHLIRQCCKELLSFRRINRSIDAKIARKYPVHITVHYRIRHTVSKRTDRCRCILPHSFQSQHFRIRFRENPIHAFGGGMKIAGT